MTLGQRVYTWRWRGFQDGCTYIDGEFSSDPDQLCSVELKLSDAAGMRLQGSDGILAKLVDDLKIASKGVRMLVVFAGDVVFNGLRKQQVVGAAEGNGQDVAAGKDSATGPSLTT